MKRYLVSLTIFFLGLMIVGISVLKGQRPLVSMAAESEVEEEVKVATEVAQESMVLEDEDEYPLPYPGLLPDHSLYFLKMGRDRVLLWLTRNPLKRGELMLLFADKRVAASLALAEKGKTGLAVSTLIKAEKYLERAVGEGASEKVSEEDRAVFFSKLAKAMKKHRGVIEGVSSRVPDELSGNLDESRRLLETLEQKVGVDRNEKMIKKDEEEASTMEEGVEVEESEGEMVPAELESE